MRSPKHFIASFSPLYSIIIAFLIPVSALAETHEVMVMDPRSFVPAELTIEVGDTVRWVNMAGGNMHDVTADDGSFASVTAASFTFEQTFMTIEEILYHCTVHSRAASAGGSAQNGRVNVIAATAAATSDVSVESIDVIGGSHEAGEDIRIKAILKNTSAEASGMFNLNVYASLDTAITTGDTLLGAISISNIAAGATKNVDENVNLSETMAAGDYFIGAIADLADTDPGNNVNVDATSIYVFTEFTINAGLNDAWFNPLTNGQGFFITVFPDLGFVSLAWFTYDTELPPEDASANLGDPGHRWLTALGAIDGDKSEMDISITSGGIFDTPPDEPLPNVNDGTITLKFNNCNEGTVSYDILSIDAKNDVPIVRIANDNIPLCDALLRETQQASQ